MARNPFVLLALAGLALVLATLACREDKSTSPDPRDVLDSPALLGHSNGSQNYIHTFVTAGTYPYHCEYHTTNSHRMAGTVVVNDQGADSAFITIHEGAFHPDLVTVRLNGQVRWQNFDDGVHHTVTSD